MSKKNRTQTTASGRRPAQSKTSAGKPGARSYARAERKPAAPAVNLDALRYVMGALALITLAGAIFMMTRAGAADNPTLAWLEVVLLVVVAAASAYTAYRPAQVVELFSRLTR